MLEGLNLSSQVTYLSKYLAQIVGCDWVSIGSKRGKWMLEGQ